MTTAVIPMPEIIKSKKFLTKQSKNRDPVKKAVSFKRDAPREYIPMDDGGGVVLMKNNDNGLDNSIQANGVESKRVEICNTNVTIKGVVRNNRNEIDNFKQASGSRSRSLSREDICNTDVTKKGEICRQCSEPLRNIVADKWTTYSYASDDDDQLDELRIRERISLIKYSSNYDENLTNIETTEGPPLWLYFVFWTITFFSTICFYFMLFVYFFDVKPILTMIRLGFKEEVPPPPPTVAEIVNDFISQMMSATSNTFSGVINTFYSFSLENT